jgi:hypothetical protein
MKYMLLIYGAENAWTEAERNACIEDSVALCHELHSRQQYLGASPLHPVATATCVRNQNGHKLVTDGPFVETHEQLGGYFLIDVPDLDSAIKVAKRIPGGDRGTVEIRPVVDVTSLPGFQS